MWKLSKGLQLKMEYLLFNLRRQFWLLSLFFFPFQFNLIVLNVMSALFDAVENEWKFLVKLTFAAGFKSLQHTGRNFIGWLCIASGLPGATVWTACLKLLIVILGWKMLEKGSSHFFLFFSRKGNKNCASYCCPKPQEVSVGIKISCSIF